MAVSRVDSLARNGCSVRDAEGAPASRSSLIEGRARENDEIVKAQTS